MAYDPAPPVPPETPTDPTAPDTSATACRPAPLPPTEDQIARQIAYEIARNLTEVVGHQTQAQPQAQGRRRFFATNRNHESNVQWSIRRALTARGHICPNCGRFFTGKEARVYCSPKCEQQYAGKGRYPHIGKIPLTERNHLAELIALQRAANRRLYGHAVLT